MMNATAMTTGTLPFLVACTLLALALLLARQRGAHARRTGGYREPSANARITWLGTYSQGFQRVLDVLTLHDARIVSADANRGVVVARTDLTLKPLPAPPITVRVAVTTQQGVNFVYMEAAPAGFPLDGGGSRRLLNEILRTWDRMPSPVSVKEG